MRRRWFALFLGLAASTIGAAACGGKATTGLPDAGVGGSGGAGAATGAGGSTASGTGGAGPGCGTYQSCCEAAVASIPSGCVIPLPCHIDPPEPCNTVARSWLECVAAAGAAAWTCAGGSTAPTCGICDAQRAATADACGDPAGCAQ